MTDHYDQNGGHARYVADQREREERRAIIRAARPSRPVPNTLLGALGVIIQDMKYPELRVLADAIARHCMNTDDLAAATRQELMEGLLEMAKALRAGDQEA